MIDGHECKKIVVNCRYPQSHASNCELYMGTYELSDYENGKPTWSSLSASIWIVGDDYWIIGDIKDRGLSASVGTIGSYIGVEWPTENNWFLLDSDGKWIFLEEDIVVKCTGKYLDKKMIECQSQTFWSKQSAIYIFDLETHKDRVFSGF